MKIALIKDESEIINGYINVINKDVEENLLQSYYNSGISIVKGDYLDFNGFAYNGEAEELNIASLIEQIDNRDINKYLSKWIDLTAIDGIIIIGGVDVFEVVNSVSVGKLNEQELNSLLYPKKGCYSAKQIELELKERELEIETVKILGYNYLIRAKKVK